MQTVRMRRPRRRLNKRRFFSVMAILAIAVLLIALTPNLFSKGEAMVTPPPTESPVSSPAISPEPIDNTIVWEKITVNKSDTYKGMLILVNKQNKLPEGYAPEDLVRLKANAHYDVDSSKQVQLHKDVVTALDDLCKVANEEDEFNYLAMSGYRGIDYQKLLFEKKVEKIRNNYNTEQEAVAAASTVVVPPYASEHHTGLALDIICQELRASSPSDPFIEEFAELKEGKWLAEHCWEYGFILRYQEEKTDITDIIYEPWHIRFVGLPHSLIMKEKILCLEEYIDLLKKEKQMEYEGPNGKYLISYQTPQDGKIMVPTDKNYTLSGDGCGGFIVTVQL